MGWFSFKSTDKASNQTTQIEQRSHHPLGVSPDISPENSDISHTLGQISNKSQGLTVKENTSKSREDLDKAVTEFVDQRKNNMFVIDGEKEIEESIICTNNETGGKTCLKLQYNSIQLFKHMQKLEYFCSLPDDINATYFECRKIK